MRPPINLSWLQIQNKNKIKNLDNLNHVSSFLRGLLPVVNSNNNNNNNNNNIACSIPPAHPRHQPQKPILAQHFCHSQCQCTQSHTNLANCLPPNSLRDQSHRPLLDNCLGDWYSNQQRNACGHLPRPTTKTRTRSLLASSNSLQPHQSAHGLVQTCFLSDGQARSRLGWAMDYILPSSSTTIHVSFHHQLHRVRLWQSPKLPLFNHFPRSRLVAVVTVALLCHPQGPTIHRWIGILPSSFERSKGTG